MAALGDPIVGVDRVVYDDTTGPGALAAKPLSSPKSMTALQKAIHDLTHLPYHPGCEICVSCRRPNTQHRSLKNSERVVPLMVGDYCFPKHSEDVDPLTVLVIRVYPYKLFLCCHVPSKGRDMSVVNRSFVFDSQCIPALQVHVILVPQLLEVHAAHLCHQDVTSVTLTHSVTQSLTGKLTRSLAGSLAHLDSHSPTHSLTDHSIC